jgi:hypothetical protein
MHHDAPTPPEESSLDDAEDRDLRLFSFYLMLLLASSLLMGAFGGFLLALLLTCGGKVHGS